MLQDEQLLMKQPQQTLALIYRSRISLLPLQHSAF